MFKNYKKLCWVVSLIVCIGLALSSLLCYAAQAESYEFQVGTSFTPQSLVPSQMLTAKVMASNVSPESYTGTKDVLVIVGLYDSNSTMINVSYISKGIAYKGVETLSAGFKLPVNVKGYTARAFMWDGVDLKTSNMIPYSNVTSIGTDVIPTVAPSVTPTPTSTNDVNIPWDWSGVVGTGQSLAVGAEANPAISTSQPYNNLKLSLEKVMVPPLDPNNSLFKMVPLVEPIRVYGYWAPGPYPGNIFGETPHTAMANQITSMVRSASGKDYITAHTVVGESGQGIDALRKGATDTGSTGRAYAATLFEVSAIKRLAAAAGKTYGVGAIIITHGERDSGNTSYENELHTLWSDYNQDISAITGQSQKIPLFVMQQHSCGSSGTSASLLAQWRVGVDYPGDIICAGPNYQHSYGSDGIHMTASGYQQLGELYGKVYYEKVVLGHDWQPLQPTNVEKSGRVITVNFHVPVPPLEWDSTLPAPNQSTLTEWKNGKGFEVSIPNGRATISSVDISGNSVKITCASDLPSTGVKVGYAFTGGGTKRTGGTYRWGLLRDSDPFKGSTTGTLQPNYCVSFELAVP